MSELMEHVKLVKRDLEQFIQSFSGINDILPSTLAIIDTSIRARKLEFDKFLTSSCKPVKARDGKSGYRISKDQYLMFQRYRTRYERAKRAAMVTRRSALVSLVSQFDYFVGRLLRWIFVVKPEQLNDSEKKFSYSELAKFNSLEDAREFLVEKEVESLLRKSHTDMFSSLEARLGSPLRKDLECWPDLIEITQRRNLFVHCDGVVSAQYISVCKEHGADLGSQVKTGTNLDVSDEYFRDAYRALYEVGVKLAHVVWRRMLPESRETADANLNNICYGLILEKEYDLAQRLLHFGVATLKTHFSEESKRSMIINQAQVEKWLGNEDRCSAIIGAYDWSASDNRFKLAIAILKDDFLLASKCMVAIGNDDPKINEESYREWPLFKEFRKSDDFASAYKKVFQKDFEHVQVELKDELVKSVEKPDLSNSEDVELIASPKT